MALSITIDTNWHTAGQLHRSGLGNLGVYATGGIAVTPRPFGLGKLDDLDVRQAQGVFFEWRKSNTGGIVLAYQQDAGGGINEVANAFDLTTVVFRWKANGAF